MMTPPTPIWPLIVGVAALIITPTTLAHPDPTPTARAARINDDGSYSFAYSVDAPEYKNFHDREEARLGRETRGRFRVALPDNRLQTVTYTADGTGGYTASVTYDLHPNFESLRQAIGPIRPAPEIGQSVLEGIRRGENWKHHGPKHDGGHQVSQNSVSTGNYQPSLTPTTKNNRPRPSPRPQPTRVRPSPTPTPVQRRRPTSRRKNSGISAPRPHSSSGFRSPTSGAASRPASPSRPSPRPSQQSRPSPRPTQQSRPSPRPTIDFRPPPPSRRPATSPRPSSRPSQVALLPTVSAVDGEDSEIINRLILAIRRKLEEEGGIDAVNQSIVKDEEGEGESHRDKKYTIGDKASVLSRLSGIVHPVELELPHIRG